MPNVKTIEKRAFYGCEPLLEVSLDQVQTIGDEAFCYSGLTSIRFPETLEYIGAEAFRYCKFPSIYLPANIKYIGSYAFCGNHLLTDVYAYWDFQNNPPQLADDCFGYPKTLHVKKGQAQYAAQYPCFRDVENIVEDL